MTPNRKTLILVAAALVFAGCDKLAEKATEKIAEKAIEAQSKDGAKASVNLSAGTAKVTTSDGTGKTATVEWGGAQVTEADLGVPFYPGSKPGDGKSSKVSTPDGSLVSVSLHSGDANDKVAAFYRDKLKASAQGRNFMDMNAGDGQTTLMLTDEKTKSSVQIHIAKASDGTDVNIIASRGK